METKHTWKTSKINFKVLGNPRTGVPSKIIRIRKYGTFMLGITPKEK